MNFNNQSIFNMFNTALQHPFLIACVAHVLNRFTKRKDKIYLLSNLGFFKILTLRM